MRLKISSECILGNFARRVEKLSGQRLLTCYQCGNCSASCPMGFAMEVLPHQIVRLVHLGQVEKALKANTIWMCASCITCTVSCPRGVDIARILEAIRFLVLKERKVADIYGPAQAPEEMLQKAPLEGLTGIFRKFSV
ncbi:MAG: 4Fe-4S dicluster domain-containing protein [Candidatus Aminicenantes bacterium]|nr:4Fe-4S dicluster domain-containing protein [Candidatus Aminicenantes bacterium]MDH5714593.1 4Fe-4S dicluster domain-containing protein [Candidatus Aminicenantes bacterium]